MDSQKVAVNESRFGKGLFATEKIEKDEVIAEFDGPMYHRERAGLLPNDIENHAIQIGPETWKDSKGVARLINHSCEPNCGIKNLIKLVAMRDIEKGEELTLDYEMTEKSDWRMQCLCEKKSCRRVIGSFDNMPQEVRAKYRGYISEWLK